MFEVKNEAGRATVYIYGTIGDDYWSPEDSNRAKEFAKTLEDLTPKPLDIRIDSPGGDVYEGFAIASAIGRYEGDTHAYVDGMAASAASYIAVMADRVTMNDFSMFMIHNAWALCVGNRDDMLDMSNRLEQIDDNIAKVISARSAMELDEVKQAMDAETWYRGDEALEAGLCDEVIETEQRVAASLDKDMAKRFHNIPDFVTLVSVEEEAGGDAQGEGGEPADGGAEDPEGDASHALSTIHGNEARDAEGAILLGNRVYRKEQ